MLLHHNHQTVKLKSVDKKTVKKTVEKYIEEHGGEKPISILAGLAILEFMRGFEIPVRFASGLQPDEIVILM